MSEKAFIREYLRISSVDYFDWESPEPIVSSKCDIFGVVVATGPNKVGWSLINPSETMGVIRKKDKDGNVKTWGINPKDATLAIERANNGTGGPIPKNDTKKYILEKAIGRITVRSMLYWKDSN